MLKYEIILRCFGWDSLKNCFLLSICLKNKTKKLPKILAFQKKKKSFLKRYSPVANWFVFIDKFVLEHKSRSNSFWKIDRKTLMVPGIVNWKRSRPRDKVNFFFQIISHKVASNLRNQVKQIFYGKFDSWSCSILLHYF